MKKILTVFMVMLMMWFQAASASEVTLFKNASGAGWDIPVSDKNPTGGFKQALEKDGLLKDEAFPTEVLAKIAYNFAKEQKLPAGALEEKESKNLFLLRNSLRETITVNEFRQLGQAGKIVVPDLMSRTATFKTEASATPVAGAQASGPTLPAAADTKQAVAIANLEGQVKALQEEVKKSGGSQAEVKALTTRLKEFGQQLQALKDGQGGFAPKADLDEAKVEFAKLKGQVDGLVGLRDDVNRLDGQVSGFEGRLSTMEGNPILAMGNKLFVWLGLLLLGCIIIAWLLRRPKSADMKVVKSELETVKGIAQEAKGLAQKADTQSASAVTKVTAVEGEVKKLTGRREVNFPLDFDAKVDGLTEAGQKYHLTVMIDDEHECHLAISLRSDNLYGIAGIDDLTTGVSRKGLKKTIGNAATVIDGKSRLQGIAPKSVSSVKAAPEPVPEQLVGPDPDDVPHFLRKQAA